MAIKNNVTPPYWKPKAFNTKLMKLPEIKFGAVEAAEKLGVAPKLVFKTIVATRTERGKAILGVSSPPPPN